MLYSYVKLILLCVIDPRDFVAAQNAWSSVPCGAGNIPSHNLLQLSDNDLLAWMEKHWGKYYGQPANHNDARVHALHIDIPNRGTVLDLGCGVGFDSLRISRAGNQLIVADICPDNIALVQRLCTLVNEPKPMSISVSCEYPFLELATKIDEVHCSGVLHHVPWASELLARLAELIGSGGVLRLMLYTRALFKARIGHWPQCENVIDELEFNRYVRGCDLVGHYADWYDEERLMKRAGNVWTLENWTLLGDSLCAAVTLRRK